MYARRLACVSVVVALGAWLVGCGAEPGEASGRRADDEDAGSTAIDASGGSGDTGVPGEGDAAGGDAGAPGSDAGAGGDAGGTDGDGGPPVDGETGCGPMEICANGLDDDCDGQTEESCGCAVGGTQPCYGGLPGEAGRGACRYGTQTCTGDVGTEFGAWSACEGAGSPSSEVCGDGVDDDCDGVVDDGCACVPGETRACYEGPAGTEGVGLCTGGTQTCTARSTGSDWGACEGQTLPAAMDVCDGTDADCDGVPNEGCDCVAGTSRSCYSGPAGTAGVGICREGTQRCVDSGAGTTWGACEGQVLPEDDACDGIDHLCNGMPSAGCVCILGATRACYSGAPATRGVGACRDGTDACVAVGASTDWLGLCTGEVRPIDEICGNAIDDDCDGQTDETCGGTLTCPGDVAVPAGQPVTLTVSGMGVSGFSWTIVSAPTGGEATATWSPASRTAATETFTPYIVGEYVIQVSGVDAAGRPVTCTFRVTAMPHGLRVQLTWDGAGDVDLHLHNGNSTPWFSDDVCWYSNLTTTWGAVLDFDNVTSDGPENIRVDTPAIGMTYTIGIHNYARAAGRTATVQVFCGDTSTTPTATFTSRALSGTSTGNCTSNDFWRVARVVFTDPSTCTITPIDTYTASTNACSML